MRGGAFALLGHVSEGVWNQGEGMNWKWDSDTNGKLGISWGYSGIRNEQYKLECVCTNRVIKPLKWETNGESEDKP